MGLGTWMPVVWCCAVLAGGCTSTDLVGDNCILNGQPCPPRGDSGPPDAGPNGFDKLDLLLVIDNTSSMAAAQNQLAQWMPDLVRAMLDGDVDGDGDSEFRPVLDVRLAVVSSDMGAPGLIGIPGCGVDVDRPFGEDGVFLHAASSAIVLGAPCADSPPFLTFDSSTSPPSTLQQQAGCRAFVGTDGCSYPMPLEAALKALWDRNDASLTFLGGIGHGISTQPGFIRGDALLGVIVVTDDDDCSMSELSQVDPSLRFEYRRCLGTEDQVHKLTRYVEGFGALKNNRLDAVFYGVIAGVPPDLADELAGAVVPDDRRLVYYKLLEDVRMQQAPEPMLPAGMTDLRKSCGVAYPPQRLVQLAARLEELDGNAAVGSICGDLSVPMRVMTTALARLIDRDTTF